jgi:prevent-host-death family protein
MADILRFRNARGDLVEVESVPATRLKNEPGALIERVVSGGAIAITRHDRPSAVLISYEDFRRLAEGREPGLGALGAEFDRLLASMQSGASRKALVSAFEASPAELGEAAVREAAGPAAHGRKAHAGARPKARAAAMRVVKRRKAGKAG